MPIVQRHINYPLSYPDPKFYVQSAPAEMLGDMHFSAMVGVLNQLGHLSSHAASIFKDLTGEAEELRKRMASANDRTTALVNQLPQVDSQVSGLTVAQLLSFDSVSVSRTDDTANANKFRIVAATMPAAIKARVDDTTKMAQPPDFSKVEAILLPNQKAENGPCADKFSNPKFFENQWLAEQEVRMEQIKEEKKRRKEERKARKAEEKKSGQKQRKLVGTGSKLDWRAAAKKNVGDDVGLFDSNARNRQGSSAVSSLVERTAAKGTKSNMDFGNAPPPGSTFAAPAPPPPGPSMGSAPPPPVGGPPPGPPPGGPPPPPAGGPPPPPPPGGPPPPPSGGPPPPPPPGGPPPPPPPGGAPPPPPGPPAMAVKDDPQYAKYFKMLKFGLAVGACKLKMQAEGMDPSILDLDPDSPSPNGGGGQPPPPGGGAPPPPPPPPAAPKILLKDDPLYSKYFKMLKFGSPVGACKLKMEADGVDPSILDMDPDSPSPNQPSAGPSGVDFAMPALRSSAPRGGGGGGGGGGGNSLLDQLKGGGGKSLKKVGNIERPKPPPDARTNLLDSIKGGQSTLKKASVVEKAPEKPQNSTGAFGTQVLDKLNAIRLATQADSDSDSDSDWDDD